MTTMVVTGDKVSENRFQILRHGYDRVSLGRMGIVVLQEGALYVIRHVRQIWLKDVVNVFCTVQTCSLSVRQVEQYRAGE